MKISHYDSKGASLVHERTMTDKWKHYQENVVKNALAAVSADNPMGGVEYLVQNVDGAAEWLQLKEQWEKLDVTRAAIDQSPVYNDIRHLANKTGFQEYSDNTWGGLYVQARGFALRELLEKEFDSGSKVFSKGCGSGRLELSILADSGKGSGSMLYLADISPRAMEVANKSAIQLGLENQVICLNPEESNVLSIETKNEKFDVIKIVGLVYYLDDLNMSGVIGRALDELVESGKLIVDIIYPNTELTNYALNLAGWKMQPADGKEKDVLRTFTKEDFLKRLEKINTNLSVEYHDFVIGSIIVIEKL